MPLDTETTGIPDFKARSHADHQPRVCSVATILVDHTGNVIEKKKVFIKPDGWKVSQFNIDHGITQELCEDTGVPIKDVYEEIEEAAKKVEFFIAHNAIFDQKMMKIEAVRLGREDLFNSEWKCTANQATPIVNLPPTERMVAAGFLTPKKPTLIEAYKHFFGKEFDGAHDAGADIQACMEIYFAMNPPTKPEPYEPSEDVEQALQAVENMQ